MSESKEKKKRYNEKLQYISRFEKWLASEPSPFRVIKHLKWRKAKPDILKFIVDND